MGGKRDTESCVKKQHFLRSLANSVEEEGDRRAAFSHHKQLVIPPSTNTWKSSCTCKMSV